MAVLDDHRELSDRLADQLHSRGEIRATILRVYSEAWRDTLHLAITERREHCKDSTVDLEIEDVKLLADIDALRVRLNHLELVLRHADTP